MQLNKLYTFTWRDCMDQTGWYSEEMMRDHIEKRGELKISGYLAYEDEEWYVLTKALSYMGWWLQPTFIPKKTVISVYCHND